MSSSSVIIEKHGMYYSPSPITKEYKKFTCPICECIFFMSRGKRKHSRTHYWLTIEEETSLTHPNTKRKIFYRNAICPECTCSIEERMCYSREEDDDN